MVHAFSTTPQYARTIALRWMMTDSPSVVAAGSPGSSSLTDVKTSGIQPGFRTYRKTRLALLSEDHQRSSLPYQLPCIDQHIEISVSRQRQHPAVGSLARSRLTGSAAGARTTGLYMRFANDAKSRQCGRAECHADWYVRRVTPTRHQHSTGSRRIIARVEGLPAPAKVRFEPGAEILGRIWRRKINVANVTRAVPRRYVQCPA